MPSSMCLSTYYPHFLPGRCSNKYPALFCREQCTSLLVPLRNDDCKLSGLKEVCVGCWGSLFPRRAVLHLHFVCSQFLLCCVFVAGRITLLPPLAYAESRMLGKSALRKRRQVSCWRAVMKQCCYFRTQRRGHVDTSPPTLPEVSLIASFSILCYLQRNSRPRAHPEQLPRDTTSATTCVDIMFV